MRHTDVYPYANARNVNNFPDLQSPAGL